MFSFNCLGFSSLRLRRNSNLAKPQATSMPTPASSGWLFGDMIRTCPRLSRRCSSADFLWLKSEHSPNRIEAFLSELRSALPVILSSHSPLSHNIHLTNPFQLTLVPENGFIYSSVFYVLLFPLPPVPIFTLRPSFLLLGGVR
ncbi:unnamed protein product [Ectocarpus sp. 4 AP-2014]